MHVFKVPIMSCGNSHLRITVMLCARADGRKMMPFVLLPRKRIEKDFVKQFKGKLVLCYGDPSGSTTS